MLAYAEASLWCDVFFGGVRTRRVGILEVACRIRVAKLGFRFIPLTSDKKALKRCVKQKETCEMKSTQSTMISMSSTLWCSCACVFCLLVLMLRRYINCVCRNVWQLYFKLWASCIYAWMPFVYVFDLQCWNCVKFKKEKELVLRPPGCRVVCWDICINIQILYVYIYVCIYIQIKFRNFCA